MARRFVKLLDEMADRLDFTWKVVAISTRHHGSVVDLDGIDVRRAIATFEGRQSLDRLDPTPRERSGIDVIRQVADALADEAAEGRLICIETTVLDIDRGEPAVSHVRAALEGQAHVVTANKGPAAFAYHELEALAESVDRVFFFEGAVMDGVPVFNLVRETMPAVTIEGFRGVINTTCHFILSELERGNEFDRALADMQARGIAEADPTLDIDGWDAAAKTAALVNVLMGSAITPHHVARTGIRGVTGLDVRDALGRNKRIRLVASASSQGGKVRARVEPEVLDQNDPLAGLVDSTTRSISTPTCSARSASSNARRADADRLRAGQRPVAHFAESQRTLMAGPLSGFTILDLTRVLSGPVLHDGARRPRRARDQGRTSRERRRHASLGPAVSRQRERVLPQHQPQQGKRHARLQAGRGPRASSSGWSRAPTCWSKTSGQARSTAPASAGTRCTSGFRASSTRRSPVTARPDRAATKRATTR